jgi:hypothetical protein
MRRLGCIQFTTFSISKGTLSGLVSELSFLVDMFDHQFSSLIGSGSEAHAFRYSRILEAVTSSLPVVGVVPNAVNP